MVMLYDDIMMASYVDDKLVCDWGLNEPLHVRQELTPVFYPQPSLQLIYIKFIYLFSLFRYSFSHNAKADLKFTL